MSEEQVEALVRRRRVVAAEVAELNEQIKDIDIKIESLVPEDWSVTIDGVPAKMKQPNRKFNSKLAIAQFTDEQKKACIERMVNDKKVREIADELDITESCMESGSGAAKVSV